MTPLQIVLVVAGDLLIFATILPRLRTSAWWIRIFDFPRLQIAELLLVVLVASVFLLDTSHGWVLLLLLGEGAALVHQGFRLFPYTPLARSQVVRANARDPNSCVRLLIANVLMHNRQADRFVALVRAHDPDVVLTAEGDDWWDERLSALEPDYPFMVKHPRDDTYGLHLFSKLELDSPEVRFLVEEHVPSIRTGMRLRSGARIRFYGVHPSPPQPGQDTTERDAELVVVGKEVKRDDSPAIVAGDLNDVAWSHTTRLFQRVSGMLDPRIGRGTYSTFPAQLPGFRWPLDHVFQTRQFTLVMLRRLGRFGSDHLPVLVELCFEPEASAAQEVPMADETDHEESRSKIEEAAEKPGS